MPPRRNSERGTALVEACVAATILIPAVAGILAIAYFSFARAWTEHWTYEAAVCAATEAGTRECENKLRSGIRSALPIGRIAMARVARSPGSVYAEARFEIAPCDSNKICLRTNAARRIALPLRFSGRVYGAR